MASPIRIATRSSRLALWQAEFVARRLWDSVGVETELVEVSTLGDRNRVDPLVDFQGLGVFTREVQNAVLAGDADLAVHSLKDLPTETAAGLVLAAFPARASRYDLLVMPSSAAPEKTYRIELLPEGARIGTGSPRRRAQLLRARPGLAVMDIRGNLDTRFRKLDDGEYDAIILAEAGVNRLGFDSRAVGRLAPPQFYPAVGQGALAADCRSDDDRTRGALAAIDDSAVRAEVTAERSALRELRAGCHAPVGALCESQAGQLSLTVVVFSADGTKSCAASASGPFDEAAALGTAAARAIIADGGAVLLGNDSDS